MIKIIIIIIELLGVARLLQSFTQRVECTCARCHYSSRMGSYSGKNLAAHTCVPNQPYPPSQLNLTKNNHSMAYVATG